MVNFENINIIYKDGTNQDLGRLEEWAHSLYSIKQKLDYTPNDSSVLFVTCDNDINVNPVEGNGPILREFQEGNEKYMFMTLPASRLAAGKYLLHKNSLLFVGTLSANDFQGKKFNWEFIFSKCIINALTKLDDSLNIEFRTPQNRIYINDVSCGMASNIGSLYYYDYASILNFDEIKKLSKKITRAKFIKTFKQVFADEIETKPNDNTNN